MLPRSLVLALFIRSLSLLLPHTFFQPDEFYQAFEPAHELVFGYGYLTWEWTDLPRDDGGDSWWSVHVVGGRMRTWCWPGSFVLIYRLLRALGQDDSVLLTFAPRLVGVCVAAFSDYATSLLATRLLGHGAAPGALFLSLTSLFNAHLLPRALGTSPETLLTTLALCCYPFAPVSSAEPTVKGEGSDASRPENSTQANRLSASLPLDLNRMDRMTSVDDISEQSRAHFVLFVTLAAFALCLRPTTLPLWLYLAAELCYSTYCQNGSRATFLLASIGVCATSSVICLSIGIDYLYTGRLVIPALTFVHQNVVRNVSSFYGATNWSYHLVQSLPIMLFPVWWWWAEGYFACLLPSRILPARLAALDRPPGMRTLARGLLFTIATLSLSPHSEWRFLHPLLPSLLIFALPSIFQRFRPTIVGCYRVSNAVRQYTRFGKGVFYLCALAPLLPWFYLNAYHGKSQVDVMNQLRRGKLGDVSGLVVLAPCHSIPWMSHLHRNIPGWFLTCEPPLQASTFNHVTSQSLFYERPVTYLTSVFPLQPSSLGMLKNVPIMVQMPSHVVLFGDLLSVSERLWDGSHVSVEDALTGRGYAEIWHGWNGFDMAQDELERRGGVRVWSLGTRRESE